MPPSVSGSERCWGSNAPSYCPYLHERVLVLLVELGGGDTLHAVRGLKGLGKGGLDRVGAELIDDDHCAHGHSVCAGVGLRPPCESERGVSLRQNAFLSAPVLRGEVSAMTLR